MSCSGKTVEEMAMILAVNSPTMRQARIEASSNMLAGLIDEDKGQYLYWMQVREILDDITDGRKADC